MTSCSMDLNSFKYDIDENLKLLNLPTTETVVGAVIGSSARSFYRNTSCSLSQVIDFGRDNGITGSWLETILSQNPELLHA
ncbi:hypothetical protein GNP80_05600 [Aliivibrio fischeri]|uniref:hypothetical protein n=1 Tax=Aliivibrio fischeri TaxID=668 RepID=UPI0012D9267E|nr:hypothetical protein [Aliivibrio fischeri]MUK91910.1 hypothetical protein [Aliivibrio fischeri]